MELADLIKCRDNLQEKTKKEINELNKQILIHAGDYKTYEELYCSIKQICKTHEEFNIAMYHCRPIFFKEVIHA